MNERAGRVIMIVAAGFVLGLAVYFVTRGDAPLDDFGDRSVCISYEHGCSLDRIGSHPAGNHPVTDHYHHGASPGSGAGNGSRVHRGSTVGDNSWHDHVPGQPDQDVLRVGPGAR